MKVKNMLPAVALFAALVNAGHSEKLSTNGIKESLKEQARKPISKYKNRLRMDEPLEHQFLGDGLVYDGINIDRGIIQSTKFYK